MRVRSVFARLLGFEQTVIEGVEFDRGVLVVHARPAARAARRCGICGRRCAGYDQGAGAREWRALDLAATRVFVRAQAVRVRCPTHGVVVQRVPWARHGARHTYGFEQAVAWGATELSRSALCRSMRVGWRAVGAILADVVAERRARADPLAGLRRIGIDELSIKRGHRYITLVVDHDTGRLVWAREGRDAATVAGFFAELGAERTAALTHVSADMGSWIHTALRRHLPARAVVCIDPFHVVWRVSEALDDVRRAVWNEARRRDPAAGRWLKGARFALWKNPDDLTPVQALRLERIRLVNEPLYTAYLLKESLRLVLHEKDPDAAERQLDQWLVDARSATSPAPFHAAAATIERYREGILAALRYRLTNARIEAVNTTLRLLVRRAYGFHSADAMIALATLKLGGERLPLPTSA